MRRAAWLLVAPAVALVVVLFVMPYANLLVMSFFTPATPAPFGPGAGRVQAHVQRVRRAGRHGAHLSALHGPVDRRRAREHRARSAAGGAQPRRLGDEGVLAHRRAALAARRLRRLPPGLRAH